MSGHRKFSDMRSYPGMNGLPVEINERTRFERIHPGARNVMPTILPADFVPSHREMDTVVVPAVSMPAVRLMLKGVGVWSWTPYRPFITGSKTVLVIAPIGPKLDEVRETLSAFMVNVVKA